MRSTLGTEKQDYRGGTRQEMANPPCVSIMPSCLESLTDISPWVVSIRDAGAYCR